MDTIIKPKRAYNRKPKVDLGTVVTDKPVVKEVVKDVVIPEECKTLGIEIVEFKLYLKNPEQYKDNKDLMSLFQWIETTTRNEQEYDSNGVPSFVEQFVNVIVNGKAKKEKILLPKKNTITYESLTYLECINRPLSTFNLQKIECKDNEFKKWAVKQSFYELYGVKFYIAQFEDWQPQAEEIGRTDKVIRYRLSLYSK
jgi:hypothetical protein